MEEKLKKINEEITEQIKALQVELKYKYVKRTGTSGNYTYWYKNPKTGKLEAGAKPSGAKQQTRKEEGKKPSSSGEDKDIDEFIKDGWDNRYGNEIGETDNDTIVEDEGDLFMEYLENEHPKLPDKEKEKLTEKFQDKLTKKLNEATKKNKTEKKSILDYIS